MFWGPELLGRTPEMCRGDNKPLPSLYLLEIFALSLLEVCVSIPPCCPWGVGDDISQGISTVSPPRMPSRHEVRHILSPKHT